MYLVTMLPQIKFTTISSTNAHQAQSTTHSNAVLLLIILLIIWPISVVIGVESIDVPSNWIQIPSRSGSGTQGIDLLGALKLYNTSHPGVSAIAGSKQLRPAYYLQGDHRDLRLPQSVFERAAELIRQNAEFTIAASLRQEAENSGTIVSFSRGSNRYLELQSSGRRNEIRLHYYIHSEAEVQVETFPFGLADNNWHDVAVSISGSQVELLVDCHPLYKRLLHPGAPDRNLSLPQLQLWIGQRNKNHSYFKGALQEVTLITGPHGYLNQCPLQDTSCPTCGQFSQLQNTVKELSRRLLEVSQRLEAAEGRITKVEECDCLKSCNLNGSVYADGASWQQNCERCACVHGEIQCRPVQCPKPNCKKPFTNPGECCPTCLKQCFLHGVMYDHGDQVTLRECLACECHDGSMHCTRVNPVTSCPPLKCPPSEQFSVPGECCKFCPGVDYCAKGHTCHANASCLNLQTTYACQCDHGFQGDGHMCNDVDECLQQGGFNGHHCHSHTKCVNTPGSYTCECLPGYRRLDKFNCVELDECSTGEHDCHVNANCINTLGSYHCQCKEGYTGDGFHCEPVCKQPCLNGGKCVGPDLCSCREGYVGLNCELDLDECATGAHQCHDTSVCVNMPGWYYCKCKAGYETIFHHNTLGTLCQDIDECAEDKHTCHPLARCINTPGNFMCDCSESDDASCQNCVYQGREILHGKETMPNGQPCKRCTCNNGVITCRDPICDCSLKGSANDQCCPQCDPDQTCQHQELTQVLFRSGDRWTYQCQTCECWLGQVDCWPLECPPLTCLDRIRTPGDCCERCNDDPCSLNTFHNTTNGGLPCTYAGRLYDSGAQWRDPNKRCTACNCKDGRICCSYDIRCDESTSPVANNSLVDTGSTVQPAFVAATDTVNRKTSAQQRRSVNTNERQLSLSSSPIHFAATRHKQQHEREKASLHNNNNNNNDNDDDKVVITSLSLSTTRSSYIVESSKSSVVDGINNNSNKQFKTNYTSFNKTVSDVNNKQFQETSGLAYNNNVSANAHLQSALSISTTSTLSTQYSVKSISNSNYNNKTDQNWEPEEG